MYGNKMELRIKFEHEGLIRVILVPQPVQYENLILRLRQLCGSAFTVEYSAAEGQFIREIECQDDLDDVINLTTIQEKSQCLRLKLIPCSSSTSSEIVSLPTCSVSSRRSSEPSLLNVNHGWNFQGKSQNPVNTFNGDYIPENDLSPDELPSVFIPDLDDCPASVSSRYNDSNRACLKQLTQQKLCKPMASSELQNFCRMHSDFIPVRRDSGCPSSQDFKQEQFFAAVKSKNDLKPSSLHRIVDAGKDQPFIKSHQQQLGADFNPLTPAKAAKSHTVKQEKGVNELEKKREDLGKPTLFSPGRWTKGKLLGQGAFGQVFTGYDVDQGIEFAVKQVRIYSDSDEVLQQIDALELEISILQEIRHEHIVEYYGVLREDDCLSIFIEFIPMGSLKDHITRFGCLTEKVTSRYTCQVLKGLAYLHSKKIVHRDVKCANILRDHRGNLKLGDFGAAKLLQSQSIAETSKIAGTPYFMAPEIIRGEACGCRSDIWSLGCTVVEMLTKNPPWHHYDGIAAIYKIGSTWPPEYELPNNASDDVKSFLDLCFAENACNRPKAEDLLTHNFIVQGT